MSLRDLSLWHETVPGSLQPRAALDSDQRVDVAIVGAGYTGLWTAYYLLESDPSLRIAIVESEIAGFGASGRNGGWCSALYPVGAASMAREHGKAAAVAQLAAMRSAVDEVVRVDAVEGLDADVTRGGTVVLARSAAQLHRARDEVSEAADFGIDLQLLDAEAARGRLGASEVLGATFTPDCAALHPAKLARRLAEVVESRGATIYEMTAATSIEPGAVHTARATLRADTVIRATEGFTPRLPGYRRALAPIYSLMIATEPLSPAVWDELGLRHRETFSDFRNLIIYGQRTADDRIVFGGRGAPYHFGSRIDPAFDRNDAVFSGLQRTLVELFPALRRTKITHRWGGPLGVARDWRPSVGLDRTTGIGWAGGYVGDGVSTTNLAGRTLRDLILGRDSELTGLSWVGHRSPNWEPEPLRWLGANAGLQAMTWADAAEARGGRPSRVAATVNRIIGR
ncbi:glycine/D-amino acid oxidase-like deaminating enzyme [Jatrophihabitans sp. GAS493]|uniref:NAD(P)/FAD-dependent oxidoreductase n=1 Tax=Jatrophihabitans sp. GAS493 TaxID=1907575 RepID=UPI000BB96510|nr:FAD-binding oxidoreductase [Jatrophihabitans sp. GAS493]SOD74185.1 glycine/D-amino acid oxidase-like deaminating enzyme [Jatrophihabitans sp. GAS493]